MEGKTADPSLNDDVIILILSMVSAKSIIRFRCVCKLWLRLLKSPVFIKMHLNHAVENNNYNVFLYTSGREPVAESHYRVDFDAASTSYLSNQAVKIDVPTCKSACTRICVGSCNGILCFCLQRNRNKIIDSVTVCLWNPSTQEYKEIVKKPYNGRSAVSYGLGYDCEIDDYKLILIVYDFSSTFSEIHVYTLGSSSWKKIGNIPYVPGGRYYMKLLLLNGAMHWVTRKVMGTGRSMVIVSFDIAKEKTKEIQIPSCLFDKTSMLRHERVGVLERDLYFSVYVSGIFELWVMKDYGVVDSWTKILSMSEDMRNFRIRGALPSFNKNGEILFNCSRLQGKPYENALISYDLKNGKSSTFLNISDTPEKLGAVTFIESLVSLNSTS